MRRRQRPELTLAAQEQLTLLKMQFIVECRERLSVLYCESELAGTEELAVKGYIANLTVGSHKYECDVTDKLVAGDSELETALANARLYPPSDDEEDEEVAWA